MARPMAAVRRWRGVHHLRLQFSAGDVIDLNEDPDTRVPGSGTEDVTIYGASSE